jgi:hypothetical protein
VTFEKAILEQEKLSLIDIALSIDSYKTNREKSTTKNYFTYNNENLPTMNIIKIAIEFHNKRNKEQIDENGYDNLSACKQTLKKFLSSEIVFLKMAK